MTRRGKSRGICENCQLFRGKHQKKTGGSSGDITRKKDA